MFFLPSFSFFLTPSARLGDRFKQLRASLSETLEQLEGLEAKEATLTNIPSHLFDLDSDRDR